MNTKSDSKAIKLQKLFVVLLTNMVFFIHIFPKLIDGNPFEYWYTLPTFLFLPSIILYYWINDTNKKERLIYATIWPGILLIPAIFAFLLLLSLSGL